MYASVVLFKRADVVEGEIISDERPLKSARKYEFGDHCIVLRVFETDGGFLMKATRNGLGGEVLFEGVVPDGQYTRVFDKGGSYWVVVISSEKIEVDATYQGVWTDEYGRLRTSERYQNFEGKPEIELDELLPPPERVTPAAREAIDINGRDIRYLECSDGGFFEGTSTIEAWYVPSEDCYKVRFWHYYGSPLPRRKASQICLPDRVSVDDMSALVDSLLAAGLADTYSWYVNRDIVDGGGWDLSIGTRDGYRWRWGGYNAYPHGWQTAYDAICALLLGYPTKTPFEGHTCYVAEWHGDDGDLGRTEIAHLYRHGVSLGCGQEWRIPSICSAIRQDLLLYRRTRKFSCECQSLDDEVFDEIVSDAEKGLARRHTTGELMGVIGFIVDHDDVEQTAMNEYARNGILEKILCNVRIRDKAAPGLSVTGWDV